jgi:glycosyltransferase involved in cell wall biosynthesis
MNTTAHPPADRSAQYAVTPGMVSFVIPNYNHARFLGAAICSALEQTYTNIEIVVVDDGSTDNSRDVAAVFGDRIRYIHQANAGLSAARNTGIAAATGEYVALLDADDLVEPNYAARLLSALAQHPGAAGAYCGFRFVDQDNVALNRVEQRVVAPEDLYPALLDGNYWVPESLLARRSCYIAMGEFDTGLRACEDWDVWLRFSRHYQLVGVEDILIRYRVVTGSMSSYPKRMLDNRLVVLEKHLGVAPAKPGAEAVHRAYANAYLRTALEYEQVGDAAAGYTCLVTAARLYPNLLRDHATYYELACSEQARGSQGDASGLDLARAETRVLALVDRLADEPGLYAATHIAPAAMQAQAHWALGVLHYQGGASDMARTALLLALRLDPGLTWNRQFSALLARTLVGKEQVAQMKRLVGRA